MPDLRVVNLGLVEYREAHAIQERMRAARVAGEIPDTLLLLEHPPVYTRGRRRVKGELPMGEDWYRAQGIDIVDVERGGKLTYHGPGQLTGYAIMAVDDIPAFVATMENAIAAALADHGLPGARGRSDEGPELTGVWIENRKIASIGIHVSHGVAIHGFAVNVDNDLQPFEWVVACGLPDAPVTSIAKETRAGNNLPCFRKRVAFRFAEAHGLRQRLMSAQRAGATSAPALA